jgi:2-polyprenyl-6-methoxyphenol hydroxylase-like FAD-dependent oxidoreductase
LAVFDQRLARSLGINGVWLAGDAAHQAAPIGVQSMNSGIFEARELAARMAWTLRERREAMLAGFAADTHATWRRLLDAGREVRALPSADPWVRDARARIVSSIPASGDDLEALLAQIGLALAPAGISA